MLPPFSLLYQILPLITLKWLDYNKFIFKVNSIHGIANISFQINIITIRLLVAMTLKFYKIVTVPLSLRFPSIYSSARGTNHVRIIFFLSPSLYLIPSLQFSTLPPVPATSVLANSIGVRPYLLGASSLTSSCSACMAIMYLYPTLSLLLVPPANLRCA